ncbi:hypothetical protein Leryth_005865 [Lithospermum erythrorhizon]|nr:hypothetical protein Leryth_005865 [Lithospermum erythrorhizon]
MVIYENNSNLNLSCAKIMLKRSNINHFSLRVSVKCLKQDDDYECGYYNFLIPRKDKCSYNEKSYFDNDRLDTYEIWPG